MTQPLLFLGCSLKKDRPVRALQKLADELRKKNAEELMAHYAVLEFPSDAGERRSRLRELARMCTQPIWYPTGKHEQIRELLEFLVKHAGKRAFGRSGIPHLFPSLTKGVENSRGFTSLEQFLSLYLGLPEGKQPLFVGRESQIQELDTWFEQAGNPYALIAEPAGRG